MSKLESLMGEWIEFKKNENSYKNARLSVEKEILELTQDKKTELNGLVLKIKQNEYTKVNTEQLTELARDNGISHDVLNHLFRWKAELNKKEWKVCSEEIRKVLEDSITTTTGKPTITVEEIKNETK